MSTIYKIKVRSSVKEGKEIFGKLLKAVIDLINK